MISCARGDTNSIICERDAEARVQQSSPLKSKSNRLHLQRMYLAPRRSPTGDRLRERCRPDLCDSKAGACLQDHWTCKPCSVWQMHVLCIQCACTCNSFLCQLYFLNQACFEPIEVMSSWMQDILYLCEYSRPENVLSARRVIEHIE